MADLPSEIITDILSRLPVKSLLRFKCVCKSWNSLIKTRNFIKLHLNKTLISSSHLHLLIWSEFSSSIHSSELNSSHIHLYFSELRHPLETRNVYFYGSCNGVVCISDFSKNDVVLSNPLTNSHLKLPIPANRIPKLLNQVILYGLGYDSMTDDYKVLKIVQGIHGDDTFYSEANLYSANNCVWKSVEAIPYNLFYDNYCYGALVKEALHYLVVTKDMESRLCKFIACFDLRTETFSLMDCPNFDPKLRSSSDYLKLALVELGGCLSIMATYYAHMIPGNALSVHTVYHADLWIMKEYGNKESWIKLFSMNNSDLCNSRICLGVRPVFYYKDEGRLLIVRNYRDMGWYDPMSKNFVELTSSHRLRNTLFDTGFFVGSLVSLTDELPPEKASLPMNRHRKISDKFPSVGFKLKL